MPLFAYIVPSGVLSYHDMVQKLHQSTFIMESNMYDFEDRKLMNNLLIDNIKDFDANFFGLILKDNAPGDVHL